MLGRPVRGEKLSLLQYSGQAVARYVRIGDQKFDQFSLVSMERNLPTSESSTLLRSVPLFQELDVFNAEISLVSVRDK